MRRHKTPEQLKAWRLEHERIQTAIELQREAHEAEMHEWMMARALELIRADELRGTWLLCPDGKSREIPAALLDRRLFNHGLCGTALGV